MSHGLDLFVQFLVLIFEMQPVSIQPGCPRVVGYWAVGMLNGDALSPMSSTFKKKRCLGWQRFPWGGGRQCPRGKINSHVAAEDEAVVTAMAAAATAATAVTAVTVTSPLELGRRDQRGEGRVLMQPQLPSPPGVVSAQAFQVLGRLVLL